MSWRKREERKGKNIEKREEKGVGMSFRMRGRMVVNCTNPLR